MRRLNLSALVVKESFNITEFKKNLRIIQQKIRDRPIKITNNHSADMVMISADKYEELLSYANKLVDEKKG